MMINAHARRRHSGITLTEILISILIMGIGLVSLASLFPVGMERLRQSQRNNRSALLSGSAQAEIGAKNLFNRQSYLAMPWYGAFSSPFDPFVQDLPLPTTSTIINTQPFAVPNGVYRGWGLTGDPKGSGVLPAAPFAPGVGLPVCYDPLWWYAVYNQDPTITPISQPVNSRFGRNLNLAATSSDGGTPSAFGLQRLTNFYPVNSPMVQPTFISPDDPVLQEDGELNALAGTGSPILPILDSGGNMTFDWSFSWLFTGRRADVSNATVYEGDVVVFHNRPFALDLTPTGAAPAGERVVEAIFAYGGSVRIKLTNGSTINGGAVGYGANDRAVLLRWPGGETDPEVKIGSWIADVTYEQFNNREARFSSGVISALGAMGPLVGEFYPAQRCHWYRVVRKSTVEDEQSGVTAPPFTGGYRRMLLTVETPVQSKTLLFGTGANAGTPVFTNAALISPYVINVFPKILYSN